MPRFESFRVVGMEPKTGADCAFVNGINIDALEVIYRTPIACGRHHYLAHELVVDTDGTSAWWAVIQENANGEFVELRTQSFGEAKRRFKEHLGAETL